MPSRAAIVAVVAVAAGAALVHPARLDAAESGITVTAEPATLTLGSDVRAVLTIQGPADLSEPVLSTNAGTIEGLARLAPGVWTARYQPPPQRYPQVAVVAAVAGTRQGFVIVRLIGQGEAVIQTKPRAHIESVRIGERTFGPVQADARGVAVVQVAVPPGMNQAFHLGKAIDLRLPATTHLHVALDRQSTRADTRQAIVAWIYAVTPDGKPSDSAHIEARVSRGEITKAAAVVPGVFSALWQLPAGPVETAQLTAWLIEEPSFIQIVQLVRGAGAASRFALETDRPQHQAGEPPLLLRITASDEVGNPAEGGFKIEPSFGAAEPPRLSAPGHYESRLTIPDAFAGHGSLEVKALSPEGRSLATAIVQLLPGRPTPVLSPATASVAADGVSEVELRVSVKDRFGNPSAEPPQARAELGAARVRPVAPGEWALDYRAPARREPGADTVTVEAAGQRVTGQVALEPGLRFLEVAPKLGIIGSSSLLGAWVAAEAGYRFEVKTVPLTVQLELSWYRFNKTQTLDTGETLVGRHDFLEVLAGLSYRRPFGESGKWLFNVGLGIGLAEVFSSLKLGDQPTHSERGAGFSYELTAGVTRLVYHGGPFLEARYWRHGNLGITNLSGQLQALVLAVGYRYEAL